MLIMINIITIINIINIIIVVMIINDGVSARVIVGTGLAGTANLPTNTVDLIYLSLLRLGDSDFPGNSLWE